MLTAGMRRYPLLSPKHSLWYRCYWKVLNPNTSRGCNQRPGQRFFRLPPPPQAKGSQSALIFQLALLVFLPPIGCPSRFQITCAKLNNSWLFYLAILKPCRQNSDMIWKDYDALTLSFAGLVYVTHLKMIDLLPLFSMISYSSSLSESHNLCDDGNEGDVVIWVLQSKCSLKISSSLFPLFCHEKICTGIKKVFFSQSICDWKFMKMTFRRLIPCFTSPFPY